MANQFTTNDFVPTPSSKVVEARCSDSTPKAPHDRVPAVDNALPPPSPDMRARKRAALEAVIGRHRNVLAELAKR